MMGSTTRRMELRCAAGPRVNPQPLCLGTEPVWSGVVSSATTAAQTLSARVSSGRTSRPTPTAGAPNEGTSNRSPSF
jgi:hypothetical protein